MRTCIKVALLLSLAVGCSQPEIELWEESASLREDDPKYLQYCKSGIQGPEKRYQMDPITWAFKRDADGRVNDFIIIYDGKRNGHDKTPNVLSVLVTEPHAIIPRDNTETVTKGRTYWAFQRPEEYFRKEIQQQRFSYGRLPNFTENITPKLDYVGLDLNAPVEQQYFPLSGFTDDDCLKITITNQKTPIRNNIRYLLWNRDPIDCGPGERKNTEDVCQAVPKCSAAEGQYEDGFTCLVSPESCEQVGKALGQNKCTNWTEELCQQKGEGWSLDETTGQCTISPSAQIKSCIFDNLYSGKACFDFHGSWGDDLVKLCESQHNSLDENGDTVSKDSISYATSACSNAYREFNSCTFTVGDKASTLRGMVEIPEVICTQFIAPVVGKILGEETDEVRVTFD